MFNLDEKMNSLPPQAQKEVLDFMEFLLVKYGREFNQNTDLRENQFWLNLNARSLEKVWDNEEDEVYNELLER